MPNLDRWIPSKIIRNIKLLASASPSTQRKLVVLDNVFPHVLSAFRIAEYNGYLKRWDNAIVCSTGTGLSALDKSRSFEQILEEYSIGHPELRDRVFAFDEGVGSPAEIKKGDLAYTVFLHNAAHFLDLIHECCMPFVFTLYPGGGFRLENKASNNNLGKVCSSPNLQKVIVTQKISRDYLIDGGFCEPEKVEFVYGGVFPSDLLTARPVAKRFYGRDKDTFDVCFVAHKYMERGVDKGYDVFIDTAKALSRSHADVFFHVVGGFDESDIDVGELEHRIRFYGPQPTSFFQEFYAGMDVILSPNAPFARSPGVFDGFPTGGCIEAGLCGVAVFCSDPLNQNIAFREGYEIVIVPRDALEICAILERYRKDPNGLYELSARGQKAFGKVFDIETQMEPRMRILSESLHKDYGILH